MTPYSELSGKRSINLSILLVVCLIACIGFIMLYFAADESFAPWSYKQIIRFSGGLVLLCLIAVVDLRFWFSISYVVYALCLVLLVAVELAGKVGMGAQRWIDLYVIVVQPSELMKIALLMALARYFHTLPPGDIKKIRSLLPPATMVIVPSLLMLRQPDLGTMLILVGAGFSIFFVAGMRTWKILLLVGAALVASPLFWIGMHDYQRKRILTFLDPERDPLGSGYHILQSKIALGSGGVWGKGLGHGSQSHLNFLPEKQTDFIFSMLCEETGIMGGAVLIFLYLILLTYGFRVSLLSRSAFGRFLSVGLTTLLFLSAFVNMAMVMGLAPVVGIPLPLVSYGGTAMMTFMMGLGLLMATSVHRHARFGRTT
jgi:rod shape determining protein RodA